MEKIFATLVAAVVGFVAMAGLGVMVGGEPFDYASADEARQQKYLENVAKGFSAGFNLSAGDAAEITQIVTDADYDLVSISVQYKDARVERASAEQVREQREWLSRRSCELAEGKNMLDDGITLRMRFFRPSGAPMSTVNVDLEACAAFLA